ncbi:MAG: hypothetical protein HZB85_08705 [Deltaproteobacteria bacterium]|nr:hypothetical protein [Deltaproteobacteria bacterium]
MKETFAVVLAALVVEFGAFGASGAAAAEGGRKGVGAPQQPGRYNVETVEYETTGGVRGLYNRKAVIKIDTATGKTWYLKEVPNKGIDSAGTTKYWVELEDYVGDRYPAFEPAR